jgi:sigma-E factor negative regulatory protein RseC
MQNKSMKEPGTHGAIQHDGTVKKVDANSVLVSITSCSACSGCHAEGMCGISGKEEKLIDVTGKYNVSPGDAVTIMMERATGYKAVAVSYLGPLILLIASLIVLDSMAVGEAAAGLISVSLLLPYFVILYLFRKSLNRSFIFKLKI